MPIFQIGLDDGRSLRIEADDQAAALAGVQHFTDGEKPSGVVAGLKQGVSQLLHGPAETAKTFLGADTSGLQAASEVIAPKNYKAAPIIPENGKWYDPRTYNWANVPQALAESAPQMGEAIIAAKLGAKIHPIAGLAAGVGTFAANSLGDTAKQAAVNRTGDAAAEANTADKTRAGLTVAAQAPFQALGVSRFLPGAGKVTAVGAKGAAQSVGQGAITAGVEGVSGAGQELASQVGLTAGTDKGLDINGNAVGNAAVTNAILGGSLAVPKMAAGALASRKYADLGGANKTASKEFAGRVGDAADKASFSNSKTGYTAVRQANEDVIRELKAAVKSAPAQDTDTAAAITRAGKGRTLTGADLELIEQNTSPTIAGLARQAHVAALLKTKGDFSGGKFTGGLAHGISKRISALANPTNSLAKTGAASLGMGAVGAAHGSTIMAYSPETLAALGSAYALMRGIDKLTGSRTPAKGFVDRFADPNRTPQLAPAPLATASVPNAPPPGTEPPLATPTSGPWGDIPQMAPANAPWGPRPPVNPTGPTVAPPGPPAPEPMNVSALNEQIKGALLMAAARRKVQGQQQANTIAQDSPAINEQGGLEALSNPEVGKRAKQLLGTADAFRRLRAEPTAEEAPQAPVTPPPGNARLPPGVPPAPPAPPLSPAIQGIIDRMKAEHPVAPPVVPEAPVVEKITKGKDGEVKEKTRPDRMDPDETFDPETGEILRTSHEEANAGPKYTGDYVPLESHELYGRGMDHSSFAEHALKNHKDGVELPEAFKAGVIKNREKLERVFQTLTRDASDGPDDTPATKVLLEQLQHIRRGEVAAKAIKYYASFMSPKMRTAVIKKLDDKFVNSMWKT